MDNPLKHQLDLENQFESSIQKEVIIENLLIPHLQPNIKQTEEKFLIDSDSIINLFSKES